MSTRQYKYLDILTALAITLILATNISNGKLVQVGPFTVSVVVLFFPITYLLSDIFTEVYGYAQARRVVWKLFMAQVVAAIIYQIVAYMPPAPGFEGNAAYLQIFTAIPRYIIGGWLAVLTGSFLNDYVMAKMKVWTNGKHLWMRTIGSTMVGEVGDTIMFYPIAFYGVLPNDVILSAMIGGYLIKVMVEVIFTPLTYWVVGKLKKLENEDYYDKDTNFNPFVLHG